VSSNNITTQPDRVDVRGPRFAAWITTAVLVVALIVSAINPLAAAIVLGLQALVFAIGAVGGPRRHPYGRVFAKLVAPRLGPVTEREPVPPLKFAQLVAGLDVDPDPFVAKRGAPPKSGFVGAHFIEKPLALLIATAFAIVAAFLNAAFGICLGCQLYPLVARFRRTPHPA